MELFEIALNKMSIYESLFFNIKAVTTFPDVKTFMDKEPKLFKQWKLIANVKYGLKEVNNDDGYLLMLNDLYVEKAIYYPEFSKIVAITYAEVEPSEEKLNRHLKKIVNIDEFTVVDKFLKILQQKSLDGVQSTPKYFPTLCGHNIINYDIPLFIKKLIYYRNKFDTNKDIIPLILKNYLQAKPWDNNVIDTINLWKFNGFSNTPLLVISDFLGLKRNTDILMNNELSQYFWKNINEKPDDTLEFIALQSANQTNLVIQIINELRYL